MDKISIFWFRRDLRLHDNVALFNALKSGKKVLPIFIFDISILEKLPKNVRILPVTIKPGEILCFSGSHLHSSSKHKSENTRFSYEIRTVCQDDLDSKNEAPNIDCELKWQFPKIFRNIKDNSPMKITS